MAGDWIKMRVDLASDPAVIRIRRATGLDADSVVGKLHRIWGWADLHTRDGEAPGIDVEWVDELVGVPGFGAAMVAAGWLAEDHAGIRFANFDRHNGKSAKVRALGKTRMERVRCATSATESEQQRNQRREEKRREEQDNTRAPGGEPPNGVEPGEANGDPAAADAAPVGSRESGAVGREPGAAPGGESRLSRIAQDGRPGSEPAGDTPTPEKANGAAPRAAAGGARAPDDPWRSPGWAHDEWARIAAAWNATDRAVPWTLVTPPNGFADLAASPGWLASALAGIAMLPDCRRFARPVPWTQFVRDLDRILAGEFRDPPPERRELAGAAAGGAGAAGGRPQRRGNMR